MILLAKPNLGAMIIDLAFLANLSVKLRATIGHRTR